MVSSQSIYESSSEGNHMGCKSSVLPELIPPGQSYHHSLSLAHWRLHYVLEIKEKFKFKPVHTLENGLTTKYCLSKGQEGKLIWVVEGERPVHAFVSKFLFIIAQHFYGRASPQKKLGISSIDVGHMQTYVKNSVRHFCGKLEARCGISWAA